MKKYKGLREKLLKEAEELWKQAVEKRDKVCRRCGGKGNVVHHIWSRIHKIIFLDMLNGVFLCSGCHGYIHRFMHPAEYRDEMTKILYDKIGEKRHTICKLTVDELEAKIKELKGID